MFESSRLELSKSALQQNLRFIQRSLPSTCSLSSVVKGNAYGHGIDLFIPLAEECGVRHFSTFSADEAYEVKRVAKPDSSLMIMGDVEGDALEWAIMNDISFFVFEMDRLRSALDIAQKFDMQARVHLEVETGMNRNGLIEEEFNQVLQLVRENDQAVQVEGICSHLAGAESISNHYRIEQQLERFADVRKRFQSASIQPNAYHLACSAAMMRYASSCYDLARIGIMQYGFFPSREIQIEYTTRHPNDRNPLQRVLSWKSRVMSVREVNRGEFVGYGTSFQAIEGLKVATVPVGYSHGYSRSLSNLGRVLIRGQRAAVIGVVNMNLVSVDVTHIEGIEKGDEVVLIGNQGEQEITVSSFSDASDQVNYELLTRLPAGMPRMVVD